MSTSIVVLGVVRTNLIHNSPLSVNACPPAPFFYNSLYSEYVLVCPQQEGRVWQSSQREEFLTERARAGVAAELSFPLFE